MDIGIKNCYQVTQCDVDVSCIQRLCSTVWHVHTVLCIPVSELVSCTFSTIPIYPFWHLLVLYQRFIELLA